MKKINNISTEKITIFKIKHAQSVVKSRLQKREPIFQTWGGGKKGEPKFSQNP